jgi:hypothetical protein
MLDRVLGRVEEHERACSGTENERDEELNIRDGDAARVAPPI